MLTVVVTCPGSSSESSQALPPITSARLATIPMWTTGDSGAAKGVRGPFGLAALCTMMTQQHYVTTYEGNGAPLVQVAHVHVPPATTRDSAKAISRQGMKFSLFAKAHFPGRPAQRHATDFPKTSLSFNRMVRPPEMAHRSCCRATLDALNDCRRERYPPKGVSDHAKA